MSNAPFAIRPAEPRDSEAIAEIYNPFIRATPITFEEQPVDSAEITRRIQAVQSAELPWLVAESGGEVCGYAYATPWRPRSAYRFSVEITVYIAPSHARQGIGSMLYAQLFALLEARGVHAVIGGIALPNEASVALHEKFGMRKVAQFEQVGYKFGRWIDVAYWQLILKTS